ncbi:hypothetical protein FRC09_015383 [Ceratobasidium sp. 395]|nr:hypothetical protein FRC09_015383 [Ceratobasidium sp. 395]
MRLTLLLFKSNPPDITTLDEGFVNENNIPLDPSESDLTMTLQSLPPLNTTPNHAEIDEWVDHYRWLRKASKAREGLADIICPPLNRGRNLRRLHALRDHSLSHFKIKPYECDVRRKRFGTKANCKRYMQPR